MKITVVGCGALGGFYGAKLVQAGQDVHFLARSDYPTLRDHGLSIRSFQGDFHVHPPCARSPEDIGPSELVVIGLKTTANREYSRLLGPLVNPKTLILTLQNGLGNEAQLAGLFGPENILGGLCFVCLNRTRPGMVLHIAHGRLVLGEFSGPATARLRRIARLFQQVGIEAEAVDDLESAHWDKLVWNIPFNGLGVAATAGYPALFSGEVPGNHPLGPCLATEQLLSDARWEQLVRELMREVIRTGQALGCDVPDSTEDTQISRTRDMGPYRASTLVDFERGHPLELESLFHEPLRRARKAGVATPRLECLCRVLEHLDTMNAEKRTCNSGALS